MSFWELAKIQMTFLSTISECKLLIETVFFCIKYHLLVPPLQAEKSNKRHRPIGIGVQGLADAFILMRYPFESEEAQLLNIHIFETIYYAALEASCELAAELGPYETYVGSPISKGVRSFHTSTWGCRLMLLDHVLTVPFWFCRSFSTTCGIKPQQTCGTGRH